MYIIFTFLGDPGERGGGRERKSLGKPEGGGLSILLCHFRQKPPTPHSQKFMSTPGEGGSRIWVWRAFLFHFFLEFDLRGYFLL